MGEVKGEGRPPRGWSRAPGTRALRRASFDGRSRPNHGASSRGERPISEFAGSIGAYIGNQSRTIHSGRTQV